MREHGGVAAIYRKSLKGFNLTFFDFLLEDAVE